MKKHLALITFFLLLFAHIGQAQDNEEEKTIEKKNHVYFSVELLKPIPWLMISNSYVFEPRLEYRSKGLVIGAEFGMVDIENTIYERMEYRNEGMNFKVGLGFDFSYYSRSDDRNNIILGGNLLFSSFEETGTIVFEDSYFGNPVRSQKNESRGIELFFTYRRVFENNVFMGLTPRIVYILTEYDEPNFPVYYVPGAGVVNIFNNPNNNLPLTIGVSIKVGYRF